jgi:hypothetical protein
VESTRWSGGRFVVLDAADEIFDRGEDDIWPVTEDGVTCAGQAQQAGGVSRELPGEVLGDRKLA